MHASPSWSRSTLINKAVTYVAEMHPRAVSPRSQCIVARESRAGKSTVGTASNVNSRLTGHHHVRLAANWASQVVLRGSLLEPRLQTDVVKVVPALRELAKHAPLAFLIQANATHICGLIAWTSWSSKSRELSGQVLVISNILLAICNWKQHHIVGIV